MSTKRIKTRILPFLAMLIMIMISLQNVSAVAVSDILRNDSFESGSGNNAYYWSESNAAKRVSTYSWLGSYSMQITASSSQYGSSGVKQRLLNDITISEFTKITFGMMTHDCDTNSMQVRLTYTDIYGNTFQQVVSLGFSTSYSQCHSWVLMTWTKSEVNSIISNDQTLSPIATINYIEFFSQNACTVYLDAVSLFYTVDSGGGGGGGGSGCTSGCPV